MLSELHVRNLGVIDELTLTFDEGMTVFTGETGAGKTLVVTAISLLMGAKADASLVRPQADEAIVEGIFVLGEEEFLLRRVIPRKGRSRTSINGDLATQAELSELGKRFVDLHGQHEHQSLLTASVQRAALDRFAQIDLSSWNETRRELSVIDDQLQQIGGDPAERAREIDLLRFQVQELNDAAITDPNEDETLRQQADVLADATNLRQSAAEAAESLREDGGALDSLRTAVAALTTGELFAASTLRLNDVIAEVEDLAREISAYAESISADPERLAEIGERRKLLQDIRRKYGATLTEVMQTHRRVESRLAELEGFDDNAAALIQRRDEVAEKLRKIEAKLLAQRKKAAPSLAENVAKHFADLALPKARFSIEVDGVAGANVKFLFAANPGMELEPLAKVASGGELARAMLALRLVLTDGPPTLIFDEVDAGIGGAAAVAVGNSLRKIAQQHQVFVVTHLAQVAAWGEHHVVVEKESSDDSTQSSVTTMTGQNRIKELARMLSGAPDSTTAQKHAKELLSTSTL